jgi:hypothetical protein
MSKILNISNIENDSDIPIESIANKVSDYSQLGISYMTIDSLSLPDKKNILDLLFSKLRINGEMILKFKNLNKIFTSYCKEISTDEEVFFNIKDIKYPTDINKLLSYISEKYNDIILYKLIEDSYEYIVSFKRIKV